MERVQGRWQIANAGKRRWTSGRTDDHCRLKVDRPGWTECQTVPKRANMKTQKACSSEVLVRVGNRRRSSGRDLRLPAGLRRGRRPRRRVCLGGRACGGERDASHLHRRHDFNFGEWRFRRPPGLLRRPAPPPAPSPTGPTSNHQDT